MGKCKYCLHYRYKKRIECCHSHGEIQLGWCTLTQRETGQEHGCMTEAETEGCPEFMRAEWKYSKGDVFLGNILKNGQKRAVAIVDIQEEYAPLAYRVRDNWRCEYSLSEADLDGYERICTGERK